MTSEFLNVVQMWETKLLELHVPTGETAFQWHIFPFWYKLLPWTKQIAATNLERKIFEILTSEFLEYPKLLISLVSSQVVGYCATFGGLSQTRSQAVARIAVQLYGYFCDFCFVFVSENKYDDDDDDDLTASQQVI